MQCRRTKKCSQLWHGCTAHASLLCKSRAPWRRRYDVRYVRRTGDRPDGCLTFWRRGAFREVTAEAVRLRDLGLRDNVALLVLLEPVPQAAAGGAASGAPTETPENRNSLNGKAAGFASGALPGESGRVGSAAQGCAVSAGESACGSAANGDMQDAAMGQPAYGQGSGKAGGASAANGKLAEGVESGSEHPAPLLLVGNTHLLFNPRRGDIKVLAIAACRSLVPCWRRCEGACALVDRFFERREQVAVKARYSDAQCSARATCCAWRWLLNFHHVHQHFV